MISYYNIEKMYIKIKLFLTPYNNNTIYIINQVFKNEF